MLRSSGSTPGTARRIACALVISALVASTTVSAAGTNDAVAAEHLFQAGQKAADAGAWDEACRRFDESLQLDPAVGTRLNLADCEEHRGHVARAWQLFEDASALLAEHDPRRELALERAAQLKARLPMLVVRVEGALPAGARIFRDEVELVPALLGTALPVDPGVYTVRLVVPGRGERKERVMLGEKDARTVTLPLGDLLPSGGASEARRSKPMPEAAPRPIRTLGWITGGVGLASLGASGLATVFALDAKAAASPHCDANDRCHDEGLQARSSALTFADIGTVTFISGAVLVAAGVGLIVFGDSRR